MQRQHRQQEGTKNFREIGSSSLAKEKIAIAKLPNYPFPRITNRAESEWPSERASLNPLLGRRRRRRRGRRARWVHRRLRPRPLRQRGGILLRRVYSAHNQRLILPAFGVSHFKTVFLPFENIRCIIFSQNSHDIAEI